MKVMTMEDQVDLSEVIWSPVVGGVVIIWMLFVRQGTHLTG